MRRHLGVALLAVLLTYIFWLSRMQWDPEMRLWRAMGDTAFILLAIALAIGPLTVLWRPAAPLVKWRRAFGIWFALTATVHAYLVWDGWARWSVRRLFGFEYLPEVGEYVLTDPGFGLANLIGIVALFWALVLAAISSDRAVRTLGQRQWKHVQRYAYVIFYLVALHAGYYLFLHYELSLRNLVFQNPPPSDPNWFRFWFLAIVAIVLTLQWAAFIKRVRDK
ncbi:hypothetical protein BBD46_02405 [Natrialba sp. SSL1]|nr:hypothetical protein BBD46_02405 [Natrialba sp. SSL1]